MSCCHPDSPCPAHDADIACSCCGIPAKHTEHVHVDDCERCESQVCDGCYDDGLHNCKQCGACLTGEESRDRGVCSGCIGFAEQMFEASDGWLLAVEGVR